MSTDYAKIEAMPKWERPTCVIETQIFLWLKGFYGRFVEGFSSIVAPLTKLTQKGVPFHWLGEYGECFQELKMRLTNKLVFKFPLGSGGFVIYSDALINELCCRDDFTINYGKLLL